MTWLRKESCEFLPIDGARILNFAFFFFCICCKAYSVLSVALAQTIQLQCSCVVVLPYNNYYKAIQSV
jgi:hypothetical protein